MATIIIESWREELEKISLTKLQMDILGISLKESKENVDDLLDDKKVIIEISNAIIAQKFCKEAEKIGANCRVIE